MSVRCPGTPLFKPDFFIASELVVSTTSNYYFLWCEIIQTCRQITMIIIFENTMLPTEAITLISSISTLTIITAIVIFFWVNACDVVLEMKAFCVTPQHNNKVIQSVIQNELTAIIRKHTQLTIMCLIQCFVPSAQTKPVMK